MLMSGVIMLAAAGGLALTGNHSPASPRIVTTAFVTPDRSPELLREAKVVTARAFMSRVDRRIERRAKAREARLLAEERIKQEEQQKAAAAQAAAVAASITSSSSSGPYPGGAFGQCVVARESGGNPQVMNATGHYGLYQFSLETWEAYGGSAAEFGHASVAYQNQIFSNALAAGGESNWAPYDGC